MDGIGALAAREAREAPGPGRAAPPRIGPGAGDAPPGRTLLSTAFSVLSTATGRRFWRAQPSAREGVWVNTSQPPDDPEVSWPSTVFNPFASESDEMVVPTGPPTGDLIQLPEANAAGYCCANSMADPDGRRRLIPGRRHGRHAAPPASIGGRLARKLAANR